MTRILVTGATGTVGEPLVRLLLESDAMIRVATRSPHEARERFRDETGYERLEFVSFDLRHPETWGRALEAVDRLFLMFPPRVGVDPVRAFADAADRVGVERAVYLSIIGAEKLPILPHRRIETHLAGAGTDWTFLRAAWFMQNLSGIHRSEIVERDEIFIPAGRGRLNFVDARDVAAVASATLTESGHEDRAYDLTGSESLEFASVAAVFSDVLDRSITYADPSRTRFALHMYRRGVDPSLIAFMVIEYSIVRLGRSGRVTDDVETVLGRPPRTIREFVEDHAVTFGLA